MATGKPITEGPVTAKINYKPAGQAPVTVKGGTVAGARYTAKQLEAVECTVKDLRKTPDFHPTLDKNGFSHVKGLKPVPIELKQGDEKIKGEVFASITETLKRETGCTDVYIFSHVIRDESFQKNIEIPDDANDDDMWPHKTTAQFGHVDQSYYGAGGALEGALGRLPTDRADTLRHLMNSKRWAIVNTWRALAPVHREPLAVADGRTVADDDLRTFDVDTSNLVALGAPASVVQLWQAVHRPEHSWWYASNMTSEEALLIKCYDTRMESGEDATCRRALHSAFMHPEDNGPARQSCEFRAFIFWENEERKGDEVEHAYDNSYRVPVAA